MDPNIIKISQKGEKTQSYRKLERPRSASTINSSTMSDEAKELATADKYLDSNAASNPQKLTKESSKKGLKDEFQSHLVYLVKDFLNDTIIAKKGGTISIKPKLITFSLTVTSIFRICFISLMTYTLGWYHSRNPSSYASQY